MGLNMHRVKLAQDIGMGFLKRNYYMLVSNKGKKIELDRSLWSTYHTFWQVYDCVDNAMVDAGIAVELEEPAWMDSKGNICEKNISFGCKVTHNITHPDYAIVLEEVGGNTNQKMET